jgi:hypothetical protein
MVLLLFSLVFIAFLCSSRPFLSLSARAPSPSPSSLLLLDTLHYVAVSWCTVLPCPFLCPDSTRTNTLELLGKSLIARRLDGLNPRTSIANAGIKKADAKEMRMLLNDAEENDGAFPAKRVFELSRMQAPEGPRMVLAAKKRRDCG